MKICVLDLFSSVGIIFYHSFQDWSRNHTGDSEIESALKRGEDPGLALVSFTTCCFFLLFFPSAFIFFSTFLSITWGAWTLLLIFTRFSNLDGLRIAY